MVGKIHINPETGATGVCHSTGVRGCPFGLAPDDHFDSHGEARQAYEAMMKGSLLRPLRTNRRSNTEYGPALSEIMDVELLKDMVDREYILTSRHPDDSDMIVLCYGKRAQMEGKWNDATKTARGLIIRSSQDDFSDAYILQRPWAKFFTLSQMESGWSDGNMTPHWMLGDDEDEAPQIPSIDLSKLDFDAPAEVTDKMDGSMLVLYRDPKGNPAVATKGSFKSEQAIQFTQMLQQNEKFRNAAERLLQEHSDTTFLFEGVGPGKNQIVLSYDKVDISMIGAVQKNTGLYESTSDYTNIWSKEKGLNTAETLPAKTLNEALKLPDRENREGMVIRIISDNPKKQMQVKIKQEDYLQLHKMRTVFSKDAARNTIKGIKLTYADLMGIAKSGDVLSIPELKATIPDDVEKGSWAEYTTKQRLEYYQNTVLARAHAVAKAKKIIDELPEKDLQSDANSVKREFAKRVATFDADRSLLFQFLDARLKGEDISRRDASREMWRATQKK